MKDLAEAWELIEEGRYGEAEALLAQDPSPEARFALGYALFFAGRHGEALALYRDLYQKTGSHRALHQVGMVLKGMGRLREALEVFEEEARLLPNDPLARSVNLYEQGHVRLLLGEKEASRERLEACLREAERALDPRNLACAHRALLEWHLRFGSPREAQRHKEAAIRGFLAAGDRRGAQEVEALA
ncbi:tetratricopeptide repeat protein [Thermus sediminis]|uniref:tetratricopeptide repeat protein n=1 Tax=Thermus sediminis TaxID=1761908 RepID=UPI000E3D27CB|nr:tetratricopeptide repeat protein [Thermus sediminis]